MAMQINGIYDHSGTDYTDRKNSKNTVSISESGKATLDEKTDPVQTGADSGISTSAETVNAIKIEPVIYTKTGEASKSESGTNISVSV